MKILILGDTGKMGTALTKVYEGEDVVGLSSKDFDAPISIGDKNSRLTRAIESTNPDVVFNCVAMLGIDRCEEDIEEAMWMNAIYPRWLAKLSVKYDFTLVHFSTDAVFPDRDDGYWTEDDTPQPVNVYGATKLAGEHLVMAENPGAYIIRLPLLFGPSNSKPQFVEKMLAKAANGETLRVADDIVCSPTYSMDAAKMVKAVTDKESPGVYHVANWGEASLFDLVTQLCLSAKRASASDFPHVGRKNRRTPIMSTFTMRRWWNAVDEYKGDYLND